MYESVFNRKGISLERLRRFCEVADAGSIADARDRHRRAQPSYSRDIAAPAFGGGTITGVSEVIKKRKPQFKGE